MLLLALHTRPFDLCSHFPAALAPGRPREAKNMSCSVSSWECCKPHCPFVPWASYLDGAHCRESFIGWVVECLIKVPRALADAQAPKPACRIHTPANHLTHQPTSQQASQGVKQPSNIPPNHQLPTYPTEYWIQL